MTEATELRILHDHEAIYVGVRCHDREPGGIKARGRERDGTVLAGDHVAIFFDTFHNRRNGYVFAVSPDEGRWDALVGNHFSANTDWDGLWDVRCRIDSKGWTAEIRIPFTTLGYDPDGSVWGFNFSRSIARKGESGRWASARPESQVHYAGDAGELSGFHDLPKRFGIEFTPYALARIRDTDGVGSSTTGDIGADARWRITPGLTTTWSLNTDFADTEVDQRQINFTRFPLFFPEKRRFFLEDSSIYRFSDLNEDLMIPYFTRRIGLSESGERVPIIGAGKLAGHVGDYEIGVTAARLDSAFGIDEKTVFATRLSRQLNERSTAGFLATYGDPLSNGDNAVVGVDYRYQTSNWLGSETLVTNLFYLMSQTDPVAGDGYSGHAYGLGVTWPGDKFNVSLQAAEISKNFDPALGFLRRNDVRVFDSEWRYLVRPKSESWYQWIAFVYANQIYTNLDNELQTRSHSLYPLLVRLPSNDEISFGFTDTLDRPEYAFTIPGGVEIPAGSYDMLTWEAKLKLAENRPLNGETGVRWGDYYGGDWKGVFANLWWNPASYTTIGTSYDFNMFDLPGGEVDSQLLSLWLILKFTPRVRWSNLIQYDTLSDTLGFNSRFSWEYESGRVISAVLSQLYWDGPTGMQRLDSELVAKIICELSF